MPISASSAILVPSIDLKFGVNPAKSVDVILDLVMPVLSGLRMTL